VKYERVYFLHIPKTGGRFLTKYILNPMESLLANNGIAYSKPPEDMRQHAGWSSLIDDKTYVISIFREPSEFFVSSVCHDAAIQRKLVDEKKWNVIDGKNLRVEKQELYEKINSWKYMKDFQSFNFTFTKNPEHRSVLQEAISNYKNNIVFDKEIANKKINRTNLLIRTKDLGSMDYRLLVKKISEDLDIEINLDLSQIDKTYFKNDASEILFNSLTQNEKDLILESFKLDKEIYENNSLFWNPN